MTSLLTATRHEGVRRRLMVSAGRSALLAGWLTFDRGDTASAHRYWDTSISAAEATLDAALLAGGSLAATLTRDLDVSITADILYQIVHILLPYSDTRAVRELLPQLTRLNRTVDLEDEAEQK